MITVSHPKSKVEWLALRGRDVTASVVGALFDASPFLSRRALWEAKANNRERLVAETPAMQRGRLLEPVAVQLIAEQHPDWRLHHNAADDTYYRDPDIRLGGTPDLLVEAPERGKGIIQIKSVERSIFKSNWVDSEGEIDAPLWIAIQATVEAYLTGASWAAVAALTVGHGIDLQLIEVPLRDGLIEAIKARVVEFWDQVASNTPPDWDYAQDQALIARHFGDGDPEHEIDLTGDNRMPILVAERIALQAERKAAEERITEIDAEVQARLGTAQVAHIGQGLRITWEPSHRAGFSVPPKTYRTLRYPRSLPNL